MSSTIDILGLGCIAVDDLIYVDAYPAADSKISVLRSERQCGGLTGTALVAACRLGARCAYAGVVGADELSQFALGRMREAGVDLSRIRQLPEAGVIHSFIVVDQRHGTRNIFADSRRMIGAAVDWPEPEIVRSCRVLFVDQFGLKGMIRATRLAREANIPVVGDFERGSGSDFHELLSLVDHLILSRTMSQNLTGKSNPAEAARALWIKDRQVVIVTCGAEGCWYLTADKDPKHHPAYPVKIVDTTGCGDVFHGAYAAGLARGMALEERIGFASASAALKATQPGGQAGIPTHSQVEAFLR